MCTLLLLLVLRIPIIGTAGYYTFGKHFLNKSYSLYSFGLTKNPYSFFLSLRQNNNVYFVNDLTINAPFNRLGFINIGFRRFSYSGILPTPSRYIGLDFYNPQFSFGVFKKEKFRYSISQYTSRLSLSQKSKRLVFVLTKDTTTPYINLLLTSRNTAGDIDLALSMAKYISFAFYAKKTVKTDKANLAVSVKKIFKNYTALGTKLAPILGIYGSFNFRPIDELTYSNNTNFTDNQGYKSFNTTNSITYNHPTLGVFSFSHTYSTTNRLTFNYLKNMGFMLFRLSLEKNQRQYNITLRRTPILITLSRTIQDTTVMDRITGMLSTRYFKERFEYFYSPLRQYILANTSFQYKNMILFSGVTLFFSGGEKEVNFSTGLNVSTPLQMISLSSVKGIVYFDKNANGIFDKEDEPMDSIKVLLDGIKSVYTDENGKFTFRFVPPGRHKIYLDLGVLPAEVGTEGEAKTLRIGPFESRYVEFKIARLGRVEGRLFVDLNVNNVFDNHDLPLEGCLVSLNGKKTWTWDDGRFIFANVPPGSYTVKVEYCPQKVIPVDKKEYNIYVMPGDNIKGLDFPFIEGEEIKVKVKEF